MNRVQGRGEIVALTSIRFFAALTVVVSHLAELGLLSVPAALFRFVDGGRSAVSLFFVLSGFVLTYNYRDAMSAGGCSRFYAARFARIYPVLLLSLAVSATVTLYLLSSHRDDLLLKWYAISHHTFVALAASLCAQLLLLTGWLPLASINQPWNGPAWSISCEAFFYAAFPWMLSRLAAMSNRSIARICIIAWCLQAAWIVMVMRMLPANRGGFILYQFPLTHLPEFLMGVGAALIFGRAKARGGAFHRCGVALVCAALVALTCVAMVPTPMPAYFGEGPLFAVLILGLALLERPVLGILDSKPLLLLGEASFSLYLIHLPLARWAYIVGFTAHDGWILLVLCIAASIVVFASFEQPMRRSILRAVGTVRLESAAKAAQAAADA